MEIAGKLGNWIGQVWKSVKEEFGRTEREFQRRPQSRASRSRRPQSRQLQRSKSALDTGIATSQNGSAVMDHVSGQPIEENQRRSLSFSSSIASNNTAVGITNKNHQRRLTWSTFLQKHHRAVELARARRLTQDPLDTPNHNIYEISTDLNESHDEISLKERNHEESFESVALESPELENRSRSDEQAHFSTSTRDKSDHNHLLLFAPGAEYFEYDLTENKAFKLQLHRELKRRFEPTDNDGINALEYSYESPEKRRRVGTIALEPSEITEPECEQDDNYEQCSLNEAIATQSQSGSPQLVSERPGYHQTTANDTSPPSSESDERVQMDSSSDLNSTLFPSSNEIEEEFNAFIGNEHLGVNSISNECDRFSE